MFFCPGAVHWHQGGPAVEKRGICGPIAADKLCHWGVIFAGSRAIVRPAVQSLAAVGRGRGGSPDGTDTAGPGAAPGVGGVLPNFHRLGGGGGGLRGAGPEFLAAVGLVCTAQPAFVRSGGAARRAEPQPERQPAAVTGAAAGQLCGGVYRTAGPPRWRWPGCSCRYRPSTTPALPCKSR